MIWRGRWLLLTTCLLGWLLLVVCLLGASQDGGVTEYREGTAWLVVREGVGEALFENRGDTALECVPLSAAPSSRWRSFVLRRRGAAMHLDHILVDATDMQAGFRCRTLDESGTAFEVRSERKEMP